MYHIKLLVYIAEICHSFLPSSIYTNVFCSSGYQDQEYAFLVNTGLIQDHLIDFGISIEPDPLTRYEVKAFGTLQV